MNLTSFNLLTLKIGYMNDTENMDSELGNSTSSRRIFLKQSSALAALAMPPPTAIAVVNNGIQEVNNLADYHVAVHADVPAIETIMIDKPDPIINPMGAKGMGEIALIGFAGAVANAVFNATGQRVRDLPITPDKVMQKLT